MNRIIPALPNSRRRAAKPLRRICSNVSAIGVLLKPFQGVGDLNAKSRSHTSLQPKHAIVTGQQDIRSRDLCRSNMYGVGRLETMLFKGMCPGKDSRRQLYYIGCRRQKRADAPLPLKISCGGNLDQRHGTGNVSV